MSNKSQFTSATGNGYTSGNFLLDSLSLAVADTRGGFDAATQERLSSMKAHVSEDPHGSNAKRFNEYVAKLTPEPAEKPAPVVRASSKLGTGMK